MTDKLFFPLLLGALAIFAGGCGGQVVVDSAGSGGAGGTGQGGTGLPSSSSTGDASTSSSASTGSGMMSPCDGTSSCETCINCTLDVVCAEEWQKCAAVQPCLDLMYCLAACQDQETCIDGCFAKYPAGADLYNATAVCVVCQACYSDCNGLAKGCGK